jgi:tRNA/rRNA methyltransferase
MALKAESILTHASVFETLQQALADCHLAFGTTRRFGKYREDFLTPKQSAAHALSQSFRQPGGLCIRSRGSGPSYQRTGPVPVFCHHSHRQRLSVHEPVACGILILYALRKGAMDAATRFNESHVPASASRCGEHVPAHAPTLLAVAYLDHQNPDHVLRAFRRLFGRTGLNDREVRILQGLWSRIDWIEGERKNCPRKKVAVTRPL